MEQIDNELAKLAAPVRRLYDETQVEIDELEAKLTAARERQRRVARALKELDPQAVKPTKRKAKKANKPSDRVVRLVTTAIMDGHETLNDICEETNLSASSVHYGLRHLREEEVIRKAGVVEGTNAAIYKPMNPVEEAVHA